MTTNEHEVKKNEAPANGRPSSVVLPPPLGAAILAGGASKRMGQNKALLKISGTHIIEVVVARLSEAELGEPIVITNQPEQYDFLGLTCISDDIPGLGPIGGILTALRHSPFKRVLVVGCDMPLLNPALLGYMASIEGDYHAIVPTWHDAGGTLRFEPLHAIYHKSALPIIEQRIANRQLKLTDMVGAINARYIEEAEIRRYDPQMSSFRNINTPQDLPTYA